MLDLEGQWFRFAGSKADVVRQRFGLSLTAYYQAVNVLLDDPAALAYAPTTVSRLRRLRDRRRATEGSASSCRDTDTTGRSSQPLRTQEQLMPAGDIETYHQNGAWHSKVEGQGQPFASGGTKDEQVAKGRETGASGQGRAHHQEPRRDHRRAQLLRPRPAQHPRLTGRPSLPATAVDCWTVA